MIKPNNEGSSIGVEIIKNSEALLDLLNSEKGKTNTRNESKTYLLEEYIPSKVANSGAAQKNNAKT